MAGVPNAMIECSLLKEGASSVAGVDEVGRGCLAGPVVAAAVIYTPALLELGVRDSKQLTPSRREKLFLEIFTQCDGIGIGWRTAEQIDASNILIATKESMREAVFNLHREIDVLLIDGNQKIPAPLKQLTLVKGDQKSVSIAAASIVAKVFRDRWMERWGTLFPQYDFSLHKGYPTEAHKSALIEFGPSLLHRKTFRGVLPEKELSFEGF